MLKVDMSVLTLLVGTVIPLVTALVTKSSASSRVKGIVNLLISMVAGGAGALLANKGTLSFADLATNVLGVYLAAQTTYTGLWKPTGVSTAVGSVTGDTGIGAAAPSPAVGDQGVLDKLQKAAVAGGDRSLGNFLDEKHVLVVSLNGTVRVTEAPAGDPAT